jgi:erythromycin esterase-like protein
MRSVFDARASELVAATSEQAYAWAELSLVGIESWEGNAYYYNIDPERSYESRDIANAYVIQKMRRLVGGDARTVVWAHNLHIMEATEDLQWSDFPGATMTGATLADELGSAYVSLGIVGYEVGIDWGGVHEFPAPTEADALERVLFELDEPYLFVDLDHAQGSPLGPGTSWILGTGSRGPAIPEAQFDGLVFLARSEPMTPVGP